jgi:hypothetical protein
MFLCGGLAARAEVAQKATAASRTREDARTRDLRRRILIRLSFLAGKRLPFRRSEKPRLSAGGAPEGSPTLEEVRKEYFFQIAKFAIFF